jgi:hypothetical protein
VGLSIRAQKHLRLRSCSIYPGTEVLGAALRQHLPLDAAERCSGRLHVGLTQLGGGGWGLGSAASLQAARATVAGSASLRSGGGPATTTSDGAATGSGGGCKRSLSWGPAVLSQFMPRHVTVCACHVTVCASPSFYACWG